jgi:hypothetical protein
MAMQITDLIKAPARGDVNTAIENAAAAGAQGPFAEYIQEVFRVAPLMPTAVDPSIVIAQSALETGYWTSSYWVEDLNPAGIGIYADGVPSPFAGAGVQTGAQAARLHLLILWNTLNGTPPYPEAVDDVLPIIADWIDGAEALRQNTNWPGVSRIDDLNISFPGGCTWACDPDYQEKVIGRGNYLFPNLDVIQFSESDTVEVTSSEGANLRSAPNLSASVIALMPLGRRAIVLSGPTVSGGYHWYYVDTRYGRGYVAGELLQGVALTNLLANPTANADLSSIYANRSDGTCLIHREQLGTQWRVRVWGDGTLDGQGVRYESANNLGLTGQRYFGAYVPHTRKVSGSNDVHLNSIRISIFYTDGTSEDGGVIGFTPKDSYETIVLKHAASTPAKTIRKVALRVTGNDTNSAFNFYIDNCRVVEI